MGSQRNLQGNLQCNFNCNPPATASPGIRRGRQPYQNQELVTNLFGEIPRALSTLLLAPLPLLVVLGTLRTARTTTIATRATTSAGCTTLHLHIAGFSVLATLFPSG